MDKREQILRAALKLFVEFGFHGTPTSRIAQEAGVSNGTLFHYFKTKDELVVGLYVYIKTDMAGCIDATHEDGETIKTTFRKMYIASMYWALEHPVEFRFTQQFHSSPYLSMVSDAEILKQTQSIMVMMNEAIEARVLKPLPVDFLFTLISSHIAGINEYMLAAKLDADRQKEIISQSFDLIWDMMT